MKIKDFKFIFYLRDNLETKGPATKKTDIKIAEHDHEMIIKMTSPKLTKSPKIIKSDAATLETTEIDGYSENDAPLQELIISFETEFAKIPTEQDLQFLDPISLYECKIQTILLMQKVFPRYATIGQKIIEKNQIGTFLGIEIDLLVEIFRER